MSQNRDSALREWKIVVGLTLIAAALRFWGFGRIGLTHFDEGVYAISGLWAVDRAGLSALDPEVIAYSPPGFPILIGLAYLVLGVADVSAVFVALLCGVATVPLAAWLGRRTFGAGAGAASAAFAAMSIAHVAFSRKALTDAPFLLAWLAAVGLGGRFLERPRCVRAVALGLAVGLAQNVKYNGWVAGLVVIVAALAGFGQRPEFRRPVAHLKTFGWGMFAAAVSGLVYLPWFRYVESHGGYSGLLRHQRSYMGGPSSWLSHCEQQLAQVVALSGGPLWSATTWAVAWTAAALAALGSSVISRKVAVDRPRFFIGLLLGAAVLAGLPEFAWWLGLTWSASLLLDTRPAVRVLAAWWLTLSILTPFYHPYARLWLPLHGAGWVMLGGLIVTWCPLSNLGAANSVPLASVAKSRRVWLGGGVVLVCLVLGVILVGGEAARPFMFGEVFGPTDDLRLSVANLATRWPPADAPHARIRVFARRPLAFYLAMSGKVTFGLVADVKGLVAGTTRPDEWAFFDEAVLPTVALTDLTSGPEPGTSQFVVDWDVPTKLDPVTRLDVVPESARSDDDVDRFSLILMKAVPRSPP